MQTKTRFTLKKSLRRVLIGISAAGAVLLLAAGLYIALRPKEPSPQKTEKPTIQETGEPSSVLPKNPYNADSFVFDGEYLSCVSGPSTTGIDVSEWQGPIDWQKVKNAGVEFVIIRLGWRGSRVGVLTEDTYAREYYQGAKEAGLRIGCYFFSQALTVEEALEEAEFALEIMDGWELDLPVAFDWEHISNAERTADMDIRTLTDCAAAFCSRMEQAGYSAMIYFNTIFATDRYCLEELEAFDFWYAMYDYPMDFPYRVDLWQYTESGHVPGIDGNVDINLHFTYEES